MSADPALAVRESMIVTRMAHVQLLRFTGEDAGRALAHLCAGTIRVRDGQVQHVLVLDTEGRCLADAFLLRDDDAYDLLYEGPTAEAMQAHVAAHVPAAWDVRLTDRSSSHAIIAIDGPFAWELVSRLIGAEVIGLPYLTFFHDGSRYCARVGKTGEYGYWLIEGAEAAEAVQARLLDAGRDLAVVEGTLEALDQAALENFFLNIRREGGAGLTPLELQLQWRVNWGGESVGLDVLRRRRAAGVSHRVTTLVAGGPVAVGNPVHLQGRRVGELVNAGWSPACGTWVALALLEAEVAVPGIVGFVIGSAGGDVAARSVSPPVINNASLFVSPQLHGWATRGEIALPPLVRP